ncbi:MAG: L,D-transpeptidase [Nitrospirales bacterium]|nr:L,D-transpeptidase [Nitrospirales bacterium]
MLPLVFAGPVSHVVNQKGTERIPLNHGESFHNSKDRVFREQRDDEVSLLLDLSKNLLMVVRGKQVIYTALAATGSGKELHDPTNPSRAWKFETPRGTFTIETKLKNPVWIRPDWAFIEKGLPVPKDQSQRLLPNALGDYALGFGDGYFIHGALYTYLLGFYVTHGCIQLNDEDLRYIFETVPVGARLVIV